jgi:hypothetical protein
MTDRENGDDPRNSEGWKDAAREYREDRERRERAGAGDGPETFEHLVERLARLPAHAYDLVREHHAQQWGIRVATLDKAVEKLRKKLNPDSDDKQGHSLNLPEPEPWPNPIAGDELLDAIAEAVRRYVVLMGHAARAVALWIVHTYLLDCFLITPRLAIRSPVLRCGKTTLLDVVSRMVLRPLSTANVTASAIFRGSRSAGRPCWSMRRIPSYPKPRNLEASSIPATGRAAPSSVPWATTTSPASSRPMAPARLR